MTMIRCPMCQGAGGTPDGREECTNCHGAGDLDPAIDERSKQLMIDLASRDALSLSLAANLRAINNYRRRHAPSRYSPDVDAILDRRAQEHTLRKEHHMETRKPPYGPANGQSVSAYEAPCLMDTEQVQGPATATLPRNMERLEKVVEFATTCANNLGDLRRRIAGSYLTPVEGKPERDTSTVTPALIEMREQLARLEMELAVINDHFQALSSVLS